MKSRRILFIVPEYPPYATGGGGVAFAALARSFASLGHQVIVVAGNQEGRSYEHEQDGILVRWISLMRFPKQPAFLSGYLPPYNMRRFFLSLSLAKESDIVHIHGVGLPFCDLAALFLRSRGVPYYLTNHGYPHRPSDAFMPLRSAFECYEWAIVKAAVAGAKRISAVSDFCANDGPLCLSDIAVIGNGIEDDVLCNDTLDAAPAHSSQELLFVGRLQADKGILLLIEALAHVPHMFLRIMGADFGAKADALVLAERLGIIERVSFVGRQTQENVFTAMRSVQAVVFPSLNEPFGLVGLEAMANGALLVTSDEGGMRSYADESTALLFRHRDVMDLARVLRRLPLEPERDRALRSAARKRATEMTWPHIARRYLSWYQE